MCSSSSSSFYGLLSDEDHTLQGDLADMVRSITRATRLHSDHSSPHISSNDDHHRQEDVSLSTLDHQQQQQQQPGCVDRVATSSQFDFGSDPFSSIMMRDPLIHLVPPPPHPDPISIETSLNLKPAPDASFTVVGSSGDNHVDHHSCRHGAGGLDGGAHHHPFEVVDVSCPRNNPAIKRRKSLAKKVVCIPAPAPANSSRPSGEVVPSDLWAWRKYGQKPIKGSPYPRGYYRCSSSKGCSARKQVERSRTDPNMLVITYTSEHNHPWPTQRNALAGSTRSHSHSRSSKLNIKELLITSSSNTTSSIKEEEVEEEDQLISRAATADQYNNNYHHEGNWSCISDHKSTYRPTTSTVVDDVPAVYEYNQNHQQSQDDDFFAELGEIAGKDDVFSYL
ncbi:unnamed protein product [Rhodiola kirilowii]